MGVPTCQEARLYYRAGRHRFDDAEFLLEQQRTTGAVYLAGYGIECDFKALILSAVPRTKRREVMDGFRGAKAHDFEWLRVQYAKYWKGGIPAEIVRPLVRVNSWSTDLRYQSATIKYKEAEDFVNAARDVMAWIEGRL